MKELTKEEIQAAKARGFLRNRGTDTFSGRVVSAGGVYTADQLDRIAACARLYGSGRVAFTTRLSAEVVGIPYGSIDAAADFVQGEDSGLTFGGTGPKIRPVTACKGTTCVFGCCDTQGLAAEIHRRYYLGWREERLPHKFKIAVGGCPNSCVKPSLNDFGVEARKKAGEVVFQVYVGGMWGKRTRPGSPLPGLVAQGALLPLLEKVLCWYRENAQPGERLGLTVDRLGLDALTAYLG